jgi:hypothetical protein
MRRLRVELFAIGASALLNGNPSPVQVIIGVSGQSTASGARFYYGNVSYLDGT